ncbi:MAG: hypothetical protein LBU34_11540 [Planctomycetaceae bacterium]|nr:hypothetical protein [Planctomycetaceae bacterium]
MCITVGRAKRNLWIGSPNIIKSRRDGISQPAATRRVNVHKQLSTNMSPFQGLSLLWYPVRRALPYARILRAFSPIVGTND